MIAGAARRWFGRSGGARAIADMRGRALDGLELAGRDVLEIGPLDRPIVAKTADRRVFYLDHCSAEQLRAKYGDEPKVRKDAIVDIDFVSPHGDVAPETIGERRFDCIVASHVIEHTPDLVGWLADCGHALKPQGVLALVIPDRRYSFDRFRRPTPHDWIEAAHEGRYRRPGLPQVIDHFSNVAAVDATYVWRGRDVSQAPRLFDAEVVLRAIADWNAGAYIDCHSWVFEHESFGGLVDWIAARFGLNLKVLKVIPPAPGQLEFYAQLVRV